MSMDARVEAAEMVTCPLCERPGGERCVLGPNRRDLDPETERGPHPVRVEVARVAQLLEAGPQGKLRVNRNLTPEQQAVVEGLATGGKAHARRFMAGEDGRAHQTRNQNAAEVFRTKWIERLRSGKPGTQGLGRR